VVACVTLRTEIDFINKSSFTISFPLMQLDDTLTTLVIGASENPERYAFKACKKLQEHGFKILAFGLKPGFIGNVPIQTTFPKEIEIDTVTLYVGPERQTALIPEIIALKPRRIIFNPGTENPDFIKLAQDAGIETEIACTLVLLATESYF